jgi:hypothetical protein
MKYNFLSFVCPDLFSTVPRASDPVFMFCALGQVFGGAECVGSRFHVLRSRTHFQRYGTKGVGSRFHVLRVRTHFRRKRGCLVLFSCFALPESFPTVPRESGPVFKLCAPGLIFGGTVGIGFRFHVLRSRTCFRRYRGRRVPFSCFVLPDSFLAVPSASGPVFMFCESGLIFDGTEGI